MGLSAEEKRRFLKALEEDVEFRLAVAGLIGLGEVLKELYRLREESERRWAREERRWKTWQRTWQKFLKDYERRWQQEEERWKREEERWQTWYNTWQKFLEDYEKRWQREEERWQTWYQTWQKFLEDYEARWKWAEGEFKWLRSALSEIREALGGGFEYYTARVVSLLLRERGVECDVRVNVTLPVDGFKEVDLFCGEPLVVGEVSVAVRSVEEAVGVLEQLKRSVEAAERFTGKRTYLKVLAVEFASAEVAEYLQKRCEAEGVYLILGRSYI
ncbi:MAG: hypothetical protein QXP31_07490 [Pyrobaculum sp.]